MTNLRSHVSGSNKNLGDLLVNQTSLDKDCSTIKMQFKDQADAIIEVESAIEITRSEINRQKSDNDRRIEELTARIDRAEADRMEKYYRQVSHLQDWADSVKDQIGSSHKMTDALSNHFCMDYQILTYNIISETLEQSLEGKQKNNFLQFMRDKQDLLGKKKLSMLNNSFADRQFISTRVLNNKQPFHHL